MANRLELSQQHRRCGIMLDLYLPPQNQLVIPLEAGENPPLEFDLLELVNVFNLIIEELFTILVAYCIVEIRMGFPLQGNYVVTTTVGQLLCFGCESWITTILLDFNDCFTC